MTDRLRLSCSDVDDLAALYVLDALGAAEVAEVAAHLADHGGRHPSFAELAGVTPFLAESIEPVAPPPDLRARVLGAVAATPQDVRPAMPAAPPAPAAVSLAAERERRARRSPLRVVLAAAAVLAIVVLGGWNVLLQQQGAESDRRLALLSDAVAAAGQPGAAVAPMTGSDLAEGAGGFAVFPPGESGYIVLTGLPAVDADQTWQAWTIGDAPVSAGLVTIGSDGLSVLEGVEPIPGTTIVALTVEPMGGSEQPTMNPLVVGQLGAPLAWTGGLFAVLR